MAVALERIHRDLVGQATESKRTHPADEEPSEQLNILADLPAVVRREQLREGSSRGDRPDTYGGLTLEQIGATARQTLRSAEVSSIEPSSAGVVLTVLISALELANTEPVTPPQLPPPWAVTSPALLDPVMWVYATAYTAALPELSPM